jgi:hypothetical protein
VGGKLRDTLRLPHPTETHGDHRTTLAALVLRTKNGRGVGRPAHALSYHQSVQWHPYRRRRSARSLSRRHSIVTAAFSPSLSRRHPSSPFPPVQALHRPGAQGAAYRPRLTSRRPYRLRRPPASNSARPAAAEKRAQEKHEWEIARRPTAEHAANQVPRRQSGGRSFAAKANMRAEWRLIHGRRCPGTCVQSGRPQPVRPAPSEPSALTIRQGLRGPERRRDRAEAVRV